METIILGDKRIGIKTSVLEEKATACNMLCCYADELKEGFFPWIDQVSMVKYKLSKYLVLLLGSCRLNFYTIGCTYIGSFTEILFSRRS